jgi:UDP-N-acetyl-D-mannosaminuronate dehydrogenase
MGKWYTVCIGTGEIGKPLYELLNGVHRTLPIDPVHHPDNQGKVVNCDFMHVCIPGEITNFNEIVLDYIHQYEPDFVFIHSTVAPGTCRQMQEKTKVPIINSPVHGKHQGNQMKKDMLRYPKLLGVPEGSLKYIEPAVRQHLEDVGFVDVRVVEGTDSVEWMKLLSTTYFGLLVAWHQEVERICDDLGLDYDIVTDFFKHGDDIHAKEFYSGVIGGHCVMPNIEVIRKTRDSELMRWIEWSNEAKKKRG